LYADTESEKVRVKRLTMLWPCQRDVDSGRCAMTSMGRCCFCSVGSHFFSLQDDWIGRVGKAIVRSSRTFAPGSNANQTNNGGGPYNDDGDDEDDIYENDDENNPYYND
jgi:hypothetical protein